MNDQAISTPVDVVDVAAGVAEGSALHAIRHARHKVVAATQGSYDALFASNLQSSLTLPERLLLALYASQLSAQPALVSHYRQRLHAESLPSEWPSLLDPVKPEAFASQRLQVLLAFTRRLTVKPVEGDREALQSLQAADLDTPSAVALAQLLAFIAYQVRLIAGLAAMAQPHERATVEPASVDEREPGAEGGAFIDIQGFTNRTLGWRSWLDILELERANPEQLAVLEESHPKAKVSEYYLTLIHQPEILRQRSLAFNAIMYAPGGLPRAERELASAVVSRINLCVYCASVHAQRYAQLAKRDEIIREVFSDPHRAGRTARERAIVHLAIDLTLQPGSFSAEHLLAARQAGLGEGELLDLIHAVAIFAWANRLMLNLGEPVWPQGSGTV